MRISLARAAGLCIAALFAAFFALHVAAIFTENVNWDELSLLERAERTLRSGKLLGGGRPGLATVVLAALARGCTDPIEVIVTARLLWLLPTLFFTGGLFFLLRTSLRERPDGWHAACLGVGILVFVPAFARWSLQVRTDQAALAGGILGSLALAASLQRPAWAVAAGAVWGVGLFFSQKLLYVLPLCAVLAVLQHARAGGIRPRREVVRAVGVAAGAALAAAFFFLATMPFERTTGLTNLSAGFGTFAYYRERIGYAAYLCMAPTLVPHALALLLTIAATADQIVRTGSGRSELLAAWLLLVFGLTIGLFHAGTFPYFWMTLGLYPAAAFALAQPAILEMLRWRPVRLLYAAAAWLALAWNGLPAAWALLEDTQRQQRAAFEFVRRNFPPEAEGFHAEGGLACRGGPEPLPVLMAEQAETLSRDRAKADRLLDEFRRRPVSFLVYTQHISLLPFGNVLKQNYVPYRDHVWVCGRFLDGGRGTSQTIELFAGGTYTWIPSAGAAPLRVGGVPLPPQGSTHLAVGRHQVELERGQRGMLVLKLPEPPVPTQPPPFYSLTMRAEIEGACVNWKFGPLM